jgi:hypothetical protein
MMTSLKNITLATSLFLFSTVVFAQTPPPLGAASNFVLFTTTGAITETGVSSITGDVGSNLGAVSGFVGDLNGTLHQEASVLTAQCAIDVLAAWNHINAQPTGTTLGAVLGNGQVLTPDVYHIAGASTALDTLTLDGGGNSDACFIFKLDGAFAAAASTTIILTNGAKASNVFWRVDGPTAFATNTTWKGTMIVGGATAVATMCNVEGRFLHTVGAISVESSALTNTTFPTLLPIELLSFSAAAKDAHVKLNWVTASETNNDYFTIKRSMDGVNFERIATMNGAGNSSQNLNYTLIDDAPLNKTSYYRLKQTSYDGQTDYSNIVAVEFSIMSNLAFKIYPNPNNGEVFNLQIPSNNAEVTFVVHNLLGKEISSKASITSVNDDEVYTINPFQKLNSGVYLVTAISGNRTYTERLMVR